MQRSFAPRCFHAPVERAAAQPAPKGKVLVVDDELAILRGYLRALTNAGFAVEAAADGKTAASLARTGEFDVVVSDIAMPGMTGLELLRAIRAHNLDVPVVLVTSSPALETAMQAVECGALRYLVKPVDLKVLVEIVEQAARLHRIAVVKRKALEHLGGTGRLVGDRAGLEMRFASALAQMWMAWQPIVSWPQREIYGFEALVRSDEPSMATPDALFDAADRLGRLADLGRAIRRVTLESAGRTPHSNLFVNLHTHDLSDDSLYALGSPLLEISKHVILEITERASLDDVPGVQERVAQLRNAGFRIAIDDLGAGYAGLKSFADLQPDVVKLDMALVRSLHAEPTKQKLIKTMIGLCKEMKMLVVAEGIETVEERDVLAQMGCDLMQGFLFARPGKPFPKVNWG